MNAYRVLAKTTYGVGQHAETEERYYFVKASTHAEALSVVSSCHSVRCNSGEPLPKIKYDVTESTKLKPTEQIEGTEIYSL